MNSEKLPQATDPKRAGGRRWAGWVIFAGAVVYVLIGGWLLFWVPGALLYNWVPTATPDDRNKLLGAAAQVVLLGLGGVIAVVGVGLSLARKRDETKAAERDQVRLAVDRDANFTARYTEAIAQLGSDSLAIRLGGVYALERIAQDSERDHDVIVQVLAAYIRNDARTRRVPDDSPGRNPDERWSSDRQEDITAAITVLGRMVVSSQTPIELHGADLSGASLSEVDLSLVDFTAADLSGANLAYADLSGANLADADLTRADLVGARMVGAYLGGVDFKRTNLAGADLARAQLAGADLSGATLRGVVLSGGVVLRLNLTRVNLQDANLAGTDLRDVNLAGADLTRADLAGAQLAGADLTGTQLNQTQWDSETIWPEGHIPPESV